MNKARSDRGYGNPAQRQTWENEVRNITIKQNTKEKTWKKKKENRHRTKVSKKKDPVRSEIQKKEKIESESEKTEG